MSEISDSIEQILFALSSRDRRSLSIDILIRAAIGSDLSGCSLGCSLASDPVSYVVVASVVVR